MNTVIAAFKPKKLHHIFIRDHDKAPWNHEISVDNKEDKESEVDSLKSHHKAKNIKTIHSDRDPIHHVKELNSKKVEASTCKYNHITPDSTNHKDAASAMSFWKKWNNVHNQGMQSIRADLTDEAIDKNASDLAKYVEPKIAKHKDYAKWQEAKDHSMEHYAIARKLNKGK